MSFIAKRPSEGTPELATTYDDVRRAADLLSEGTGPVAIDVERAGAFLYRDEACLIQLRREDSGSFLIDPMTTADAIGAELAPVLNCTQWILHSATSDLPSLYDLGLTPGSLFDTELAGRFGGFDKVNLAALVDEFFDITLLKQHGNENWSQRPLPQSWLNYAALDVEYLIPLAADLEDVLDKQGKLGWFEEECTFIQATYAEGNPNPDKDWTSLKGLSRLKKPKNLQIAKLLWEKRQEIAREGNVAVSRVLKDKTLVSIAEHAPGSYHQLRRVPFFSEQVRSHSSVWLSIVREVEQMSPSTFPSRSQARPVAALPDARLLRSHYPDTWDSIQAARDLVHELSLELEIPAENLLKPAILRTTIWEARDGGIDVTRALADQGARDWQIELTAPLITEALGPRGR